MQLIQACPRLALDQHFYRAVRQLQQLEDGGDRTDFVNVARIRIVDRSVALGHQHDFIIGLFDHFEGPNRLVPSHEQGRNHVWKHDDVPQRQHRKVLYTWHLQCLLLQIEPRLGGSSGYPACRRWQESGVSPDVERKAGRFKPPNAQEIPSLVETVCNQGIAAFLAFSVRDSFFWLARKAEKTPNFLSGASPAPRSESQTF